MPQAKSILRTLFVLSCGFFIFLQSSAVHAAPVLQVEVTPEVVLLGGQARYTVTVKNTDASDKGYNLTFNTEFDSNRTDPEGRVTFASASDDRGSLAPTSAVTDANTGITKIDFINVKDLAANETYTFTLAVDLSGDTTWEALDDLKSSISAKVNTAPDGSGTDVTASDNDTTDVLPIALVRKDAKQSTGVEQATGTIDRPYTYEIEVQNNHVNNTDNVVVTDTLPDGIEFLGVTSGHNCTDSRANNTGITTIVCNLNTMSPSANEVIIFNAGIRYDYFGTDNGGTNRVHNDFDGTPATGTPIPDKTTLVNHADLDAQYQGTAVARQSNEAPVTAAYATVSKSGNTSSGGNGDVVNYTIKYVTSEYYNILDGNTDDNASSITIHDLLPDGQTFNNNASPTQSSFVANGSGTTNIYWNSSVLNDLAHSGSFDITFSATVDSTWQGNHPIVAADRMTNTVDSHGEWDDQVNTARANGMTDSSASASFGMKTPGITKEVEDPNHPGTWVDMADAVIGDNMRFRVRFNTTDGANPIVSNVNLGDIVVTDWLPPGMTYNGDAVETHSGSGNFSGPNTDGPPTTVTIGGLNGIEWNLGNITQGGWWQAIFTANVANSAAVTDGRKVNNIWKMTGENTSGEAYSDRDVVAVTYHEPRVVLAKNSTNVPSPLKPGDTVEYTVTMTNSGGATAQDVSFVDTVAEHMDDVAPTVTSVNLNGAALAQGTGYVAPVWDSGSRKFTIDFNDGAVETAIPAGQAVTIVYQTTVDATAGAGESFNNVATVAYNTQDNGSGKQTDGTSNVSDDNTDNASVSLPKASITKSASSGPYTIGDTISYTLNMTVPQGQIAYWPEIGDTFNRDGITYVANSAAITGASFDSSTNPNPVINTNGNNNTTLQWLLASPIDNRGQTTDHAVQLTYKVMYTGVEDNNTDWEFFLPTSGDQVNNTAQVRWADYPATARTTNMNAGSNTVTVDIDQPLLTTAKTITSSGPYIAGSTISYQVVLQNTGDAAAYDVKWVDNLPSVMGNAILTSVTHSASGSLVSGTHFQENFSSNPIAIDFDGGTTDTNLSPGESITIVYSATTNNDIGAGANVTNVADVDWSSQNGVVTGERVYDDAAPESAYTSDTGTAQVMITAPVFDKSIVSPTSGQAVIGETVKYRLRTTVPAETVLYSPKIQDVIATDGMQYVNNSLSVTNVSGNPEVAASITAAPTVNTTSPNPGATIDFVFDHNIDNAAAVSPTGDTDYVFDVTYDMIVTGLGDNGTSWIWDPSITTHSAQNTANLQWTNGSASHSQNDNASINIAQPHLTTTKNFNTESVAGGNTVTATVTITNDGNGTAYEFDNGADFTDVMNSSVLTNPSITSFTHSAHGTLNSPADYSFVPNATGFTLEYNSAQTDLAPGETLTLVYTLNIDPLIGAGVNVQNNADADYTSMAGMQPNERIFADSDPLEGNADTGSDNVTTPQATIVKSTSLSAGTATIGENFDYVVTMDIPTSTTVYNTTITDTVPDGLTVTGVDTSPTVGSVTYTEGSNGTTPITWNAGDVSDNPSNALVMTVHVRVDNTFSNTTPLDGLPAEIDGDGQDTIANNASVQWDNANTGGTTYTRNNATTITIVEPHPTITKSVNSSVAGIGDTMNYGVVIANNGTSTLYNINWRDTLPEALFESGVSPTSLSVVHSVRGNLAEGTDYTSNFGVNPVTISFNTATETTLAVGESVTISYNAVVENTAGIGDILMNKAEITFAASQPNSNPNRRSYYGSAQKSVTIASTSIGDFVWHDANANGIQDSGENGIEGVRVELRDATGNPVDNPLSPGTPYIVTTNSGGNYVFTHLSAGDYRVYFDTSAGYGISPEGQGGNNTIDSDVSSSNNMTGVITLAHDVNMVDIDAGLTTASIGGVAWLDVNGDSVQDTGDTRYAGITVHLLDSNGTPVNNPANPSMPYIATTDALGNYLFDGLVAGNYHVQFDAPSGHAFSLQDQGSDDTLDSDVNVTTGQTAAITLAAGENNTQIDAGVYVPVRIGDTVWEDNNLNGVQDSGENGIENVSVALLDGSGTPVNNPANSSVPYVVTTNASGNYLFEGLLPGNYQVAFVAPAGHHFTHQNQGGDDATDSDADTATGRSHVITTVSGTSEMTVDAGMYRTVRIGDKVWRDDERDGIQASWEPGLGGVSVELLDDGGAPVDHPENPGTPYVVTTDANGNYVFEGLVPGTYSIRFTPPADHAVTQKDQGGDDARDSDIDETTRTTESFTVVSGKDNTITDAGFYALYANVFDPPHAKKTVGETGENEVEWTMVWINDGNMAAINTQVLDSVPENTTYVNESLSCDARGTSTTSVCVYDVVENRVRWEGNIASDPGGTNEENSLNEVVIRYRSSVAPEIDKLENKAEAHWDANGDRDFSDDINRGQKFASSDDPATAENFDATVWTRAEKAEGNSSIGNYIWHDINGDGVQDENEPGLENIRVKLTWAGPDGKFGNSDDHVWRTDTNHNGHYLFEDLPEGKFKVEVKEADVEGWVQTYEDGDNMNNQIIVKLGKNDHHTKADFGYNTNEMLLARTGDNVVVWIVVLLLGVTGASVAWRFVKNPTV